MGLTNGQELRLQPTWNSGPTYQFSQRSQGLLLGWQGRVSLERDPVLESRSSKKLAGPT